MAVKIILDTDPGGDDAFALLWLQSLVRQGLVDLVAVTTVGGNVSAAQTFTNASQLLHLGGCPQVKLGRGVELEQPEAEDASHIHGDDGLGNLSAQLPALVHDYATAPRSDDLLIEQLKAAPGQVRILTIGPLTNLAAAETKSPGILQLAREIIVMGGAFLCGGNVTLQAEFNIWFNPKAAQTVLHSRNDIVVLPLDVTRHLILTREQIQTICQVAPQQAVAQFIGRLSQFLIQTNLGYRETGGKEGFLVHDAATLGYLFYPETFLLRRAWVGVETQGQWTRGQTVFDRRHAFQRQTNAWVALEVDAPGFFTNLLEDLKFLVRAQD